ncbi:MAG: hypothetical protein ACFFAS_14035 [Promethearchaeota archaeon]
MKIYLAHEKIDAKNLELIPTHGAKKYFRLSPDGKKVENKRYLIFDRDKSNEKLLEETDLATMLKDDDVDLDLNAAGRYIKSTSRISVKVNYDPVYNFKSFDVITRPDGKKQERPHERSTGNIHGTLPVKITEELFELKELLLSYVFRKSYFITHYDGASYKFLFDIAKKLFLAGKFALVEAYNSDTKKKEPLVLYDGGRKFPRAFLEGRVKDDAYCLILHISDQELKIPKK